MLRILDKLAKTTLSIVQRGKSLEIKMITNKMAITIIKSMVIAVLLYVFNRRQLFKIALNLNYLPVKV